MTAEQMQYHFELKINQFKEINKVFTSTDIAVLLNQAQDEAIKSRYTDKLFPGSIYFEKNEKVRTELYALIADYLAEEEDLDDESEELHDNAVFVDLPDDYLYSIKESCIVSYTDCNNETKTRITRVLPIRYDEYMANIENPFKKPYKKLIWRLDFGIAGTKQHELIHGDDCSISSYHLRYLKQPVAIDIINGVDCELHETVHEEIVDRAVQLAIGIMQQTNNSTNQNQET